MIATTGMRGRLSASSRAVIPDSVNATISLQPSSSATEAATRVRLRVTGVPGATGPAAWSPRRASPRLRIAFAPCSSV